MQRQMQARMPALPANQLHAYAARKYDAWPGAVTAEADTDVVSQALWLVGGKQQDADELLWKVPGAQKAGPVLIPQEPFAAAYSREMGVKDGAPSTGFVGAQTCKTPPVSPLFALSVAWI